MACTDDISRDTCALGALRGRLWRAVACSEVGLNVHVNVTNHWSLSFPGPRTLPRMPAPSAFMNPASPTVPCSPALSRGFFLLGLANTVHLFMSSFGPYYFLRNARGWHPHQGLRCGLLPCSVHHPALASQSVARSWLAALGRCPSSDSTVTHTTLPQGMSPGLCPDLISMQRQVGAWLPEQ